MKIMVVMLSMARAVNGREARNHQSQARFNLTLHNLRMT
jgi:hypothetical protein